MKIELTLKVDKKVLFKVDNDSYGKMPLNNFKTEKMGEVVTFLIKVASSVSGSGAGLLHANGMPKKETRKYFKKTEGLFKEVSRDSFDMAVAEYDKLKPKMRHLVEKDGVNPFLFKIRLYLNLLAEIITHLPSILGAILTGHQVEARLVRIDPRDKDYQSAVKKGPEAVEEYVKKMASK